MYTTHQPTHTHTKNEHQGGPLDIKQKTNTTIQAGCLNTSTATDVLSFEMYDRRKRDGFLDWRIEFAALKKKFK